MDELCGVSAILNIPFVVIVQSHLLRDKGSVRLRCVTGDSIDSSGSASNEQVVSLDNLAFTIRELTAEMQSSSDDAMVDDNDPRLNSTSAGQVSDSHQGGSAVASVDCIYVDHDQYYDSERPVSKAENSNWKVVMKTMKSISQRGEQFLAGMMDPSILDAGDMLPIFAVADISFWALRDFGTYLMKKSRSELSTAGACNQAIEEYPKYKRIIKTLGAAIESFMRRNGYWTSSGHRSGSNGHSHYNNERKGMLNLLLYSRSDDRFDLVSLEASRAEEENGKHHSKRK